MYKRQEESKSLHTERIDEAEALKAQMATMTADHAQALTASEAAHVERLTASHAEALESLRASLTAEHKAAQDAARSQREESHALHAEQIDEAEARHKAVSASLSALRDEHSQSERARAESDRKAQSLAEDLRAKHRELDAARGDGAAQEEASAAQLSLIHI